MNDYPYLTRGQSEAGGSWLGSGGDYPRQPPVTSMADHNGDSLLWRAIAALMPQQRPRQVQPDPYGSPQDAPGRTWSEVRPGQQQPQGQLPLRIQEPGMALSQGGYQQPIPPGFPPGFPGLQVPDRSAYMQQMQGYGPPQGQQGNNWSLLRNHGMTGD
jgi:hypothetical protein